MDRTDVRVPWGEEKLVLTDRVGSVGMRGRTGVGVARRPEVRRLRTVVSQSVGLTTAPLPGSVSQALFCW